MENGRWEPPSLTSVHWTTGEVMEGKQMAESSSGGGNAGLAFIVGGLVVVVAVLAWFLLGRGGAPETKKVDVDVKLPEVSAPAVPSSQ